MTHPDPFAYDGLLYLNGGTGKVIVAIKSRAIAISLLHTPMARTQRFVAWPAESPDPICTELASRGRHATLPP